MVDHFAWAFTGVYGPPIVIEADVSYGRSYLAFVVGGKCLGMWEVILM